MLQSIAPGPKGRAYVGDATEGPEDDAIGSPPYRAAGEGVSEFVHGDDGEESDQFGDVPEGGGVVAAALHKVVRGDEEPGPVEENRDSEDLKESEAIFWHMGIVVRFQRVVDEDGAKW